MCILPIQWSADIRSSVQNINFNKTILWLRLTAADSAAADVAVAVDSVFASASAIDDDDVDAVVADTVCCWFICYCMS